MKPQEILPVCHSHSLQNYKPSANTPNLDIYFIRDSESARKKLLKQRLNHQDVPWLLYDWKLYSLLKSTFHSKLLELIRPAITRKYMLQFIHWSKNHVERLFKRDRRQK